MEELGYAPVLPVEIKAYVLQQDHPETFSRIREIYSEIFPTVTDLRVGTRQDFDLEPALGSGVADRRLAFGAKERGVEPWIVNLSDGMRKVLIHLIELGVAPPDSVVVIDEIENSLGVNCLPDLAQFLLSQVPRVQLIMTSHHPQVINTITPEYWRLVTRHGSVVTIRNASRLPALQTASPLQKFTQLINLAEYEEGIT